MYQVEGSGDQVVKVSACQPCGRGFETLHRVTTVITPHYDTSTGWLQEVDSIVIYILSCEILFRNRAKICLN